MEFWSINVTLCDFRDENILISMIDGTAGIALALAVQDKHRSAVVLARKQLTACSSTYMYVHAACVHVNLYGRFLNFQPPTDREFFSCRHKIKQRLVLSSKLSVLDHNSSGFSHEHVSQNHFLNLWHIPCISFAIFLFGFYQN